MEAKELDKQMKELRFRKDRLDDRLRELEGRVSGMTTSFLPLVRNEAGRFSEGRAQALIDQLVEAYRDYRRLGDNEEELSISQEEEELYRSFLYCVIRYTECPPRWVSEFHILPDMEGNYGDILQLAESLAFIEKNDLLYYEMYDPYLVEGFFACMDELYHQLNAVSVIHTVNDADIIQMWETHWKKAHRQELETLEKDTEEFQESMDNEQWQEFLRQGFGEVEEVYEEVAEERAEYDSKQERRKKSWMADFQEPETFCERYLLFRKLYFDIPSRRTFHRDIRYMLETMLLQKGVSCYQDDDFYFYALATLEKAAAFLDRKMGERR